MTTQRFSVEFDHRTVGVALRVPGGFVFYASDKRFGDIDGRVFPRARAIQRELKRTDQKKWKRNRRERLSFAI